VPAASLPALTGPAVSARHWRGARLAREGSGQVDDPDLPAPDRHHHRGRGLRKADGGSTTLEIAILAPTLLALTFTVVQAGLWFYARSLALAAAQEGVTAGRAWHAPSDAGPARARTFLTEQAGDSLTGATVTSGGTTATIVRITVTGRALSVLPGVPGMTVTQSAQASRESFTTPGGTP
jgi:Flp pilus assembly protein TadG